MEQASTGKIIIKTAIITTLTLAVACVLVAVLVFFCFPYQGYKFTNDLGMKKSALFFAEKYADGDNPDGLVYCVELDKTLIAETGDIYYDHKMIAHTEKLLSKEPDDATYFKKIDEYYIANSPREAHVGLYSYKEYLTANNYLSRQKIKEHNKMVFRGLPAFLDDIAKTEDMTNMELSIIYSSLYKAIDAAEGKNFDILFDENNEPTKFYDWIKGTIPKFIGELADVRSDTLCELFYMRNVINLVNGVIDLLDNMDLSSGEWYDFFSITGEKKLPDEYASLYMEYINQ